MSVREIRGKRLPARGLEEPDATGSDAPEISEAGAARSAAEQQRNRPDAKLARKGDRHRRVEEPPDERQRQQQRDQSDGYEGEGREEDERGRPLADDGFESLGARFGGSAPGAPESRPEAKDVIPAVDVPPADLSSLPTAEYDLSSLPLQVRPALPPLGAEATRERSQIHSAVRATLPPSAPTRGELPVDELSQAAPLPAPLPPRRRPLAGVPLGQPVPAPPSSTGFEAIEILSQIVHGSAPTSPVPAVTMPELPVPPAPTSPTQVIPVVASEEEGEE